MNLPELQISERVKNIPEALSIYMNNIVYRLRRENESITTLSLGEAYFDIPKFDFNGIDFKKGYHYSESQGLPELREIIADYYNKRHGAHIDSEKNVIISAGSKPLLFMAMQAVLNPGDEVLIHEPAWLSYPEEAKLADAVPKYIPYDCEPCDFCQYITDKTKMLILNNPNNPAGRLYTKEQLGELYAITRQRGIYLLLDEAYSDFLTDEEFVSVGKVVPSLDGVIIVNSLSKNLGISGWRIGYLLSTPEVVYSVLKLNQHLITCASTVLLMYVAKYFNEIVASTLPQAKAVTAKRQRICEYIEQIGLEKLKGASTFYCFVSLGKYGHSSLEFAMYLLLKYKIAVVPGSAYGKSTDGFIRIGIGVEKEEVVRGALDIIKKVIDTNEYDAVFVQRKMKELQIKPFIE